jgi:hypothetical protein
VVQQKVPAGFGTFTATKTGVLFQWQYRDIGNAARYLIGLNLPFVVHQPPVLQDALLHLADQMIHSATGHLLEM